MHYIVLIIIPRDIFVKGHENIRDYISEKMEPYNEEHEKEPYILKTKEQIENEFELFKDKYDSIGEYCKHRYGNIFDFHGNLMSTYNDDAIYDYYEIGGRWNGLFTDNYIKIDSLLEKYKQDKDEYLFCTIVNKDGNKITKHDRSFKELSGDDEWDKIYTTLLENNKEDYVTLLDCHI